MSGRNAFDKLTKDYSPERRARVDAKTAELRSRCQEQKADIEALAILPDEEIDTGDIPEILDWSGAKRGRLFEPPDSEPTA